mmetsp:Transcript_10582/g.22944  ORF Transcript_10582/g.22944 Transcript_10582/m.22944 type:complete len:292 (+) Transcript_10582:461-1336(+)
MSTAIEDNFRAQNIQGVEAGAGVEQIMESTNSLVTQLISKISNLEGVMRSQTQRIDSLESHLLQSRFSNSPSPASPQAASRSRRLENAGASPRPQQRARVSGSRSVASSPSSPQSPLRSLVSGVVRSINNAVRSHAPPARPTSTTGTRKNDASGLISSVIFELVSSRQLGPDTPYVDTIPPPSLLPDMSTANRNIYRWSMKVVAKAVTTEQDKLFRSASTARERDMAVVSAACTALDTAIVEWILDKEGEQMTSRNNKALVFGIGNRAKKLGTSVFEDTRYGNLRNMFGRN